MRYRLLGTTRAFDAEGVPVALGGVRLRALVTVLALRGGRTVPVGVLVDEVWGAGADAPADAPAAVQALVARARRALGADAVLREDGGYRLDVRPDDVDVLRFERLVAEGTRAAEAGEAAELLAEALGLWQDPALADLPDRQADAAALEHRLLDARRARWAAALELGEAEAALPELAALAAAHPLDEPLQALRLRALRDTGRGAEALAAYETVRRTLAGELGADPGAELRSLHAELLDATSADPSPGRGPVRSAEAGGAGSDVGRGGPVEPARATGRSARAAGAQGSQGAAPGRATADGRVSRAGGAGGSQGPAVSADTVPDRAAETGLPSVGGLAAGAAVSPGAGAGRGPVPQPVGNLRGRLTSFVGREADIDAIRADLGRARLVTLLGPGGAGKTRLSQEAAEAAAAEGGWPDGVWLAELAPVDDPAHVTEAVVTAVRARETVLRGAGAEELRAVDRRAGDPLEQLVEHCAPRRMLLLLDNCEHVVESAARLAEQLLARCPQLTVLATSREPLGVPGEWVRPVGPLPADPALRLFAERAAAARPGFDPAEDPEAAREICRRLDGLPLAIELAAARLRVLTPRQIADRLDDRFRLLTGGSRTALPRQQTLRAVVDWSWDLLDAPERAGLRKLSVFARGCGVEAAEAVLGLDALDVLGSLVDKSLLVAAPAEDGAMRYRLLETVAEYAAERLDASAERPSAERAHLTYYRELARETDALLRGPGQTAAIATLETEYENLRTALRRAVAAGDEQEVLVLVHALSWYWQIRDLRTEARHWSRAACALGPDPFAPGEPAAEPVLARATDGPPPLSGEALREARRGVHLIALSGMDHDPLSWSTEEARARMERIAAAYRPGLPQVCRPPGFLWFYAVMISGPPGRLRELADACVATSRELGWDWELASAYQQRAALLANRAELLPTARSDASEALRLFERIGDAWGVAEALSARGEAAERSGDYDQAIADFTAATGYAERLGAEGQVVLLRVRLGGSLIETGRGEEGEAVLRKILESERHGPQEAWPAARLFLAQRYGRTGRYAEAREQLATLMEGFGGGVLTIFEGIVLGLLSWVAYEEGCHEEALEHSRGALTRARDPLMEMVAPQVIGEQLTGTARVLSALGRVEDAVRLLGAGDARLPEGHEPVGFDGEIRRRCVADVRAAFPGDDRAFAALHAGGGRLSLDEAAALAGVPLVTTSSWR
ncbi:BTAD domain-containing putative transcriptional regulator [Streptomyces sp. NPDC060194]|uniref:AfsR/SARP family transcriptional regulator n=1 Tax=Streptomyces sp. NPDC060194 TaxID=3347069 RepID=UPI003669131D